MVQELTLKPEQLGHRIVKVVPSVARRLLLTFDNGEVRRFDLALFIEPGTAFETLGTDLDLFRTVQVVDDETIGWPNGIILDPDVLYYLSVQLKAQERTDMVAQEIATVRHPKKIISERRRTIVHRAN